MGSAKELESYARECVRLAQLTTDPHIRELLFQRARELMSAVMDEDKGGHPRKSPLAEPGG